jgi:hypothetical protein
MADLAGLLLCIYDQNCKSLKRITKLEKHIFQTTRENTKHISINRSIVAVNNLCSYSRQLIYTEK